MALFDSIQSIKGFPRKFKIVDDVPKINWSAPQVVEKLGEIAEFQMTEVTAAISAALSNIQHNSLIGINPNDHHDKVHGDTHDGSGSDPLKLPLEFKHNGTLVMKIDSSGNLFIKGRVLKIT